MPETDLRIGVAKSVDENTGRSRARLLPSLDDSGTGLTELARQEFRLTAITAFMHTLTGRAPAQTGALA